LVFENFDFSAFDVVISSTAHFAKGIIVKPGTLHICYCHTPPRFLYHYQTEVNRRKIWYLAPILSLMDNYFRVWDYAAAQRVDWFLTNSENTAQRIRKFYRRDADIIYPPVEMKKFEPEKSKQESYFLIVSRLAQYKRIDLAIEACNKLGLPLKIIGMGRDEKRLQRMAGNTVEFLGQEKDDTIAEYYNNCQAFIFPGEDDFGITPVEAMSFGKPVIALGKGGALETVVAGKTGEFFSQESAESLMMVLKNFHREKYDPRDCRDRAELFSKDRFQKKFSDFVTEKWETFQKTGRKINK
jgi:glycosyltransferase involved in cell wall biosynthesis